LDYLLTPEVEVRLARGASAQFPLHSDVDEQPRVHQEGIRHMEVDFQAAADEWDSAAEFLRDVFAAAD
jgi:iron(III) transport system substrate-binding protein